MINIQYWGVIKMDLLEKLLLNIKDIAKENGLDAYIIGTKKVIDSTEYGPTYIDDGRLLKIAPLDNKKSVLLEIELDSKQLLRLYKHRTSSLTRTYRGRLVRPNWVLDFIKANSYRETEISKDLGNRNEIAFPLPSSDVDEVKSYFVNVDSIFCKQCGGDGGLNNRCTRCGGNGLEPSM